MSPIKRCVTKTKLQLKNLKCRKLFGDLCIQAVDERMLLTQTFKAIYEMYV